jgi:hypothetical protein
MGPDKAFSSKSTLIFIASTHFEMQWSTQIILILNITMSITNCKKINSIKNLKKSLTKEKEPVLKKTTLVFYHYLVSLFLQKKILTFKRRERFQSSLITVKIRFEI